MTYFFWIFDPRFDELLNHFIKYLKNKGIKNIKPIIIRAFPCDKRTAFKTFVLNHKHNRIINLQEPEELNKIFTKSITDDFDGKWSFILNSQNKIPLVSFTNQNLPEKPFFDIYGSSPSFVFDIDSKAAQLEIFKDMDIPLLPHKICKDFPDVKKSIKNLLADFGPVVIMPERSSGGYKAAVINSVSDLYSYKDFLYKINPDDIKRRFIVSRYLPNVKVPACNALITQKGDIVIIAVVELIFKGFRFGGFIYPTFWSDFIENNVAKYTKKIGRFLADKGYRGYFDVDFLLDSQKRLWFTEINPRYTCDSAFLFSALNYNLFSIMEDDYDKTAPILKTPSERIVIFKISPKEGFFYKQNFVSESCLKDFIKGKSDFFKQYYWNGYISIEYGTFIGLAGRRFPLHTKRDDIISFYHNQRTPA